MRSAGTFKEWQMQCSACHEVFKGLAWSFNLDQAIPCPACGSEGWYAPDAKKGVAPGMFGDELPVGYEARHGVCHPDGTPRRFDSKTELKRALNEAGLTIMGDTPVPYRVPWSGVRKKD